MIVGIKLKKKFLYKIILRPVLIFRKFSRDTFLGIPLTTSIKDDMFHYKFNYKKGKDSCASLSQIKLFDAKRINQKDGKMNIDSFNDLKEKLKKLMDLYLSPKNFRGFLRTGSVEDNYNKFLEKMQEEN